MIISISLVVIAGLLLLNTIFLIMAMVRASQAFREAQKLMEMARLQIAPISHDVTQIISHIRTIVQTAEKEMDKVGDSIEAVRDTARNIKEFESLIQERIERPLLDVTAVLSALVKGGRVFWQSIKKK
ncbi:MAG: DUF948 domain-containing protein [Calditrichaeota bacterium]|nr:MAG: DUF948 domain-containing protein [Calditrichota bacterium]